MSGHAAAATTLAMTVHTLHVIGAGGWIGGLGALMLVAVPAVLRSGGEERHQHVAGLVSAFSPTALGFAGLLVVTGAIAAWRNIGSVAGLWQEPYGRVLMVKLALLSVAAGTGAYNWKRVLPSLGSDTATGRLRKSAALELTAALVVLVVTAVLVATPMPSDMMDAMAP
jgi:putative copper export protein